MFRTIVVNYSFGQKFGQSFRKTLPLDYKKGDKHSHRNTHAIPLKIKDKLIKNKDWKTINELQRNSLKPFGKFSIKGFTFDKQKLPFYDIPDLTEFKLKPYVAYLSPKLDENLKNYQTRINQQKKAQLLSKDKVTPK